MKKNEKNLFSRPPLERMLQIHSRLQAGEYPNCQTLARTLEVCARTIERDLDFLRERWKLPIEYDALHYGFYYSRPVKQFPAVTLTEAEVFGLLVAHKAIAQYRGTPYHRPLQAAFRRLTCHLDPETQYTLGNLDQALSFRPFAPDDTDLHAFQVVNRAVQQRRALRFHYKNLGAGRAQPRHVHPYHLACIDNHWYLFAFDLDRQALRTFVLTRLSQPAVTPGRFTKPKGFQLAKYLEGSFTVFKGDANYEVVIEFDGWATDLVRGRRWHASQEFTELPNGASRLRFLLNNVVEMERWVLSWGAHATVVRPRILAARMRAAAEALVKRYADVSEEDLKAAANAGNLAAGQAGSEFASFKV